MIVILLPLVALLRPVLAHGDHSGQVPIRASDAFIDISQEPWTSKYGPQSDTGYSGPLSFSHFEYARCLQDASQPFDIGIIGFPFDTTTSYRPGALLHYITEMS